MYRDPAVHPQRIAGPFWRYYGGKWRSAPFYPPPRHKQIVEPFAGAAGYSLRHAHHDVLLIDANEKICGIWDYLIRASEFEILSLPDLPRDGGSVDDLDIPQEARWLMGFWCNAGAATPCKVATAWNTDHYSNWDKMGRGRCAKQSAAIKHWKVLQGTYLDAPDIEATWFIDPPYQGVQGKHYPHSSDSIDYSALADWCKSRQGYAIVCEGPDADWLPFEDFRAFKATPSKLRDGASQEFIWCSDGWDASKLGLDTFKELGFLQ